MSGATGVAAGAAIAGAGATVYGANKNAKSIANATAANISAAERADARAYARWLETRGVGSNGEAINARLPRWANVRVTVPGAGMTRLVKKGTMPATKFGIVGPDYRSQPVQSIAAGGGGTSAVNHSGGSAALPSISSFNPTPAATPYWRDEGDTYKLNYA